MSVGQHPARPDDEPGSLHPPGAGFGGRPHLEDRLPRGGHGRVGLQCGVRRVDRGDRRGRQRVEDGREPGIVEHLPQLGRDVPGPAGHHLVDPVQHRRRTDRRRQPREGDGRQRHGDQPDDQQHRQGVSEQPQRAIHRLGGPPADPAGNRSSDGRPGDLTDADPHDHAGDADCDLRGRVVDPRHQQRRKSNRRDGPGDGRDQGEHGGDEALPEPGDRGADEQHDDDRVDDVHRCVAGTTASGRAVDRIVMPGPRMRNNARDPKARTSRRG